MSNSQPSNDLLESMLRRSDAQWVPANEVEILLDEKSGERFALEATSASAGPRAFAAIHSRQGLVVERIPVKQEVFLRAFDSAGRPFLPRLLRELGRGDLAAIASACAAEAKLPIEVVMLPGCAMQVYCEMSGATGYPRYAAVVHQDVGGQIDEWEATVSHLAIAEAYKKSTPLLRAAARAELEFTLKTPFTRKASDLFAQIHADLESRDLAQAASGSPANQPKGRSL